MTQTFEAIYTVGTAFDCVTDYIIAAVEFNQSLYEASWTSKLIGTYLIQLL